ncbi:hypothetical protein DBR40_12170 [Pedobacter sp. KBW01]|nr:hypothetical protein DBR40_12170 [Pedobacter sp. KBW01]
MKSLQHPYRSKIFSRIWALLILVIFVNATLVESLHDHRAEKSNTENQYLSKGHPIKQLSTPKLKCKLCEVLKHRAHFFNIPSPTPLALPITKPVFKTDGYLFKHTVVFILSCSNKGPPALIA